MKRRTSWPAALLTGALVLALLSLAPVGRAQNRPNNLSGDSPNWRRSCLTPIKYRVGRLDARFGITREDFQRHVEEAAEVWAAAAGRKLFSADDRGGLEIDLVYDGRQEVTEHFVAARAGIAEKIKAADAISDETLPMRNRIAVLDNSYSSQSSSYREALTAYNKIVAQLNAKGGVPEAERQSLDSQKLVLQKRAAQLQAMRQEQNLLIGDLNALVRQHNMLVDRANAEAKALNESGVVGVQFEQGRYFRRSSEEHIHIFEYESETGLVVILAHEMGHALGIRHNGDPASIMSPLVHTKTPILTAEDREGLKTACSPG
jgi:hypothetical protein